MTKSKTKSTSSKKSKPKKDAPKPEEIFPFQWKHPEINLEDRFAWTIEDMPRILFEKMRKKKRIQGFSGMSWVDYWQKAHEGVVVEDALQQVIYRRSGETLRPLWMTNYAKQLAKWYYKHDEKGSLELDDNGELIPWMNERGLSKIPKFKTPTALVVGAGPTIRNNRLVERLVDAQWKGNIVTTDRMTIPLIQAGLELACVMSVDGNPTKIPAWFDKPELSEYNETHTPLKVVVSSTTAPETIDVLEKHNCDVYWFHGLLDMFFNPDSITRVMSDMVPKVTMLSCGGNAGTAAWNFAHYLGARVIGLIGLDFGYTMDEPIEKTAYYDVLSLQYEKKFMKSFYRDDYHPFFQTKAYTDIIFYAYRETFRRNVLAMNLKGIKTINCTEGGTLHGEGIIPMWFDKTTAKAHGEEQGFLEAYPK